MSGEEKARQIGEAMLLCEDQKRELAHVELKIAKVKEAYRVFALEGARWQVDISSEPWKTFLSHPAPQERDLPAHLLSQSQLAALIIEHKKAQEALASTRATLAKLGITSC